MRLQSGVFCIVFFITCAVNAQSVNSPLPDSALKNNFKDSVPHVINWDAPAKKGISYKPFIVPTAMVVYGILSRHTDALQDWNEKMKDEWWTEHPHKPIHI